MILHTDTTIREAFTMPRPSKAEPPTSSNPKSYFDALLRQFREIGEEFTFKTMITPEMAAYLLTVNDSNRDPNKDAVDRYAASMASGNWKFTGEGVIVVSDDGRLNTGQQRCMACVKTGVPFVTNLTIGVPRDNRRWQDQGRPINTSSRLKMQETERAGLKSVTATALIGLERGVLNMTGKGGHIIDRSTKLDPVEIVSYAMLHGAEIERFKRATPKSFIADKRMIPTLMWLVKKGANERSVMQFGTSLATGLSLTRDNPIWCLRTRLEAKRNELTPAQFYELAIRTWNVWISGLPTERSMPIINKIPDVVT